jgi:hypothetical protein
MSATDAACSQIVSAITREAQAAGLPVHITAAINGRAVADYRRLAAFPGFGGPRSVLADAHETIVLFASAFDRIK